MQISFDPLAQQEAAAVRAMLDALHAQQVGQTLPAWAMAPRSDDEMHKLCELAGQTIVQLQADGHLPTSAAPLAPPAPPTAAADLFSTAPAAPPAISPTNVPTPPVPSAPIPAAPSAPAPAANLADVDSTGLPWDERIHSGTKAKNADGTWRARRGLNNPGLVKEVEAQLRQLAGIPVSAGPLPPSATAPTSAANATEPAATATESASSATVPAAPIATAPENGTVTTTSAAPVPPAPLIPSPPIPAHATTAADTASATNTTAATSASAPIATAPVASPEVPNVAATTSAPPTAPIPTPPAPTTAAADTAPVTFGTLMTRLAKAVSEKRITTDQVDEIVARHGIAKGQMGQMATKPDVVQLVSAEVTLLGA